MRLSRSITALCFGVAASVVVAAGHARATDYFAMDLRGAEFAPQPIGPATGFHPGGPAPSAAAPSIAPRADAGRPAASPARKIHVAQVHRATHARRSPLNAYASLSHARPCAPGGVCVWDGKLRRWRAP
jgi:hypothetical protein